MGAVAAGGTTTLCTAWRTPMGGVARATVRRSRSARTLNILNRLTHYTQYGFGINGRMGYYIRRIPIMNMIRVSGHLWMMRRIIPAFNQAIALILPMKAVLTHLNIAIHNLKQLEHLQHTAIAQTKPITE
jgi:hypothetical protein